MTSELRPAVSPWECFRDKAYYDMWCLRRENWRTFGQGFHLMRGEEAEALRDLLNEQAAELAKYKALAETLAGALPDDIDLFRIIRAAGRSNSAKAQAVYARLSEALRQYKEAHDAS